mmetsp:Transcript_10298/g.20703  ORF Transcript_10298/g.20703 Transcript_10298/m.20703 type:complete len:230 (-) Transcript_10298:124-813(-)
MSQKLCPEYPFEESPPGERPCGQSSRMDERMKYSEELTTWARARSPSTSTRPSSLRRRHAAACAAKRGGIAAKPSRARRARVARASPAGSVEFRDVTTTVRACTVALPPAGSSSESGTRFARSTKEVRLPSSPTLVVPWTAWVSLGERPWAARRPRGSRSMSKAGLVVLPHCPSWTVLPAASRFHSRISCTSREGSCNGAYQDSSTCTPLASKGSCDRCMKEACSTSRA